MKKFGIKTIDNLPLKHREKILEISDEREVGDGIWIYLKEPIKCREFDPFCPTSQIHEWTVAKAVYRLRAAS